MTAAAIAIAALFGLGGTSRLPSAIHNPSRRPVCIALLCFAAALTFDIPAVYAWLDHAVGVANFADLAEHGFGITGVFALLLTLEDLTDAAPTSRPRLRLAVPVAAVVASASLFFAARTKQEANDFTDRYGHNPYVIAYWGITLGYFAIVLVALGRLIRRHSARCARTALRIGLRLVGAGVAAGVLYSALKIVQLGLSAVDNPDARYVDWLDAVMLVVGAALIGAGLLLPALETAWTAAAKHLSDRLALLRLRHLWLDVTEHVPDVVLDGRRSLIADLVAPQPSYRLYRRVIEIRDVQLTAETAPHTLGLPAASLALLDRGNRPYGMADHGTVRDELASLLDLARVWVNPRED